MRAQLTSYTVRPVEVVATRLTTIKPKIRNTMISSVLTQPPMSSDSMEAAAQNITVIKTANPRGARMMNDAQA